MTDLLAGLTLEAHHHESEIQMNDLTNEMTNALNLTTQRVKVLEREIRSCAGSIRVQIRNRKDHPSYGYLKSAMWADFNRLQGMLAALQILRGESSLFNAPVRQIAMDHFDIDLVALANEIKNA